MSQTKTGRKFGQRKWISPDREMAQRVALALRKDFGKMTSAVKQIAQITMANVDTATNWYQGKNMPGARYLLRIARVSPSVLKIVLTEIGGEPLWEAFQISTQRHRRVSAYGRNSRSYLDTVARSVSDILNVTHTPGLNDRQTWLLAELQRGVRPPAKEIASLWKVSVRTVFRDFVLMHELITGQLLKS